MPEIQIGAEIKRRLDASPMTVREFAKRLCIERNSVYNIFKQKSIDIDRLIKISQILNFDFLSLYSPTIKFHNHTHIAVTSLTLSQLDNFLTLYPHSKIITL